MRKLCLLSLLVTVFTVTAQNTFPTNGNVGIGTTSPSELLDVVGTVKAKQGYFNNVLPNGTTFSNVTDRNNQTLLLGAGTDSASQPLFCFYDMPQSNIDSKAKIWFHLENRNDIARFRFIGEENGSTNFLLYNKLQQSIYSLYENNDNVYVNYAKPNTYLSIGTSSYNDNGDLYHLSVNGKVRADAVKVYTDWADFVFDADYNLPSLKEVEQYISKNGHLKDIPSAKEVEENGIELGEMNKLLLQKIEELTLYTIQLKKEVEELKSKID